MGQGVRWTLYNPLPQRLVKGMNIVLCFGLKSSLVQCFSTLVPPIPSWVPEEFSNQYQFEYLGYTKYSILFERFHDLKKVEKHWLQWLDSSEMEMVSKPYQNRFLYPILANSMRKIGINLGHIRHFLIVMFKVLFQ